MGFWGLCFILKTNLCKYISTVNVGSRLVSRVSILKLFKFSISSVSYVKSICAWRSLTVE